MLKYTTRDGKPATIAPVNAIMRMMKAEKHLSDINDLLNTLTGEYDHDATAFDLIANIASKYGGDENGNSTL